MCQRGKGAVGGSMAIATDYGHTGQGSAVFRAHHVHDALAQILERKIRFGAEMLDIAVQRFNLLARNRVLDAQFPMIGGGIVVSRGHYGIHAPRRAIGQTQAFKRLRAGYFVDQMAVDIDQTGAIVGLAYHMGLPEFVVKRLCSHFAYPERPHCDAAWFACLDGVSRRASSAQRRQSQ